MSKELKVDWFGYITFSNHYQDKYTGGVCWAEKTLVGLREDGVVVWKKEVEDDPRREDQRTPTNFTQGGVMNEKQKGLIYECIRVHDENIKLGEQLLRATGTGIAPSSDVLLHQIELVLNKEAQPR